MAIINSINNFRVAQWTKLKDKAHRDKQKLFMAEGYHLALEAHKTNHLKEIITTEPNKPFDFDVPTYQVTPDVMQRLSSMATPTKIIGICHKTESASYGDSILLVDQVHHPGNLGTIIRSAVAFNVDTVVTNNSVDVYNHKVIQASQGMIFHINVLKKPIVPFVLELKDKGYQIIGTDVKECVSLNAVKVTGKRAVLVGNEGEGLGRELLNMCDVRVTIEMNEKCESLNVGVATSIVLYSLNGYLAN